MPLPRSRRSRRPSAAISDGPSPTAAAADPRPARQWLLLLHQLPAEPSALRVRVWRRLQALGALQLRGSTYLLPDTASTREDFGWLAAEIRADGGEAAVWVATPVDGLDDDALLRRFAQAVDAEATMLASDLRAAATRPTTDEERRRALGGLRARFESLRGRDHLGLAPREALATALAALANPAATPTTAPRSPDATRPHAVTWVTRADVWIDRMASAWLIRRFIDPAATFRFTREIRDRRHPGELRFDMADAEHGHQGSRCTFEGLCVDFALAVPGLAALAEVVHDLDLKDDRYGRPEAAGLAAILRGLVASEPDDHRRLELSAPLFDALLANLAAAEPAASNP